MIKKNYDSDFCGSLPLHQINLIQPYGYLFVANKSDLRIIQASENVNDLLGEPVDQVVGKSLEQFIRQEEADLLKGRFGSGIDEKVPLTINLTRNDAARRYIALVHVKSDYVVLEVEEAGDESTFLDVFQELKYVMAEINRAETVAAASKVVVEQLKKLSGFDKILMYQFDEQWNGTVIAEVKEDGMEEYLGHKFPASDIPKQARKLYLKNSYRLIPSREYTPVKLYPVINPVSNTFIDLSDCNLRAVAAVHLEYMKNMKIRASMSVRVIRDDKLWGLISCHHKEPMYLNYEMCSVFELLSSVISNKISSLESGEEYQFVNSLQEKKTQIIENVYSEKDLVAGMLKQDLKITDLFSAGGAAVSYRGSIETTGEVPDNEELKNLIYWLQSKPEDKVYHTSNLSSEYDFGSAFSKQASGMISIPVNADRGEYIMMFRPEVVTTVKWGGNPDEAINFESNGVKYHPRSSFGSWQEVVKQTAEAWKEEEVEVAENLRSFIFEYSAKTL